MFTGPLPGSPIQHGFEAHKSDLFRQPKSTVRSGGLESSSIPSPGFLSGEAVVRNAMNVFPSGQLREHVDVQTWIPVELLECSDRSSQKACEVFQPTHPRTLQ